MRSIYNRRLGVERKHLSMVPICQVVRMRWLVIDGRCYRNRCRRRRRQLDLVRSNPNRLMTMSQLNRHVVHQPLDNRQHHPIPFGSCIWWSRLLVSRVGLGQQLGSRYLVVLLVSWPTHRPRSFLRFVVELGWLELGTMEAMELRTRNRDNTENGDEELVFFALEFEYL